LLSLDKKGGSLPLIPKFPHKASPATLQEKRYITPKNLFTSPKIPIIPFDLTYLGYEGRKGARLCLALFPHSLSASPLSFWAGFSSLHNQSISDEGGSNRLDDMAAAWQNLCGSFRYRVRGTPQFSRYVLPLFGWYGYDFFRLCQIFLQNTLVHIRKLW